MDGEEFLMTEEENSEILRWSNLGDQEKSIRAVLAFCDHPNPRYAKTAHIRGPRYVADVKFLLGVIEELRREGR